MFIVWIGGKADLTRMTIEKANPNADTLNAVKPQGSVQIASILLHCDPQEAKEALKRLDASMI